MKQHLWQLWYGTTEVVSYVALELKNSMDQISYWNTMLYSLVLIIVWVSCVGSISDIPTDVNGWKSHSCMFLFIGFVPNF